MATYREWIKRISDLPSKKIPSLDEMKRGLEFVGHPEKAFESIHVAGTNGKGSVCTKVAKALSLEGYRVGLYISPHISSYRERISINGLMISEEEVVKYLERIFQIPIEFSFFEISTLLAFMYFADQLVEFAVLETGLGGRYDATNVVDPIVSVITSIGWDHMHILGDTLEAIACEKGGIIKREVPLVLGPFADEAILLRKAMEMNCELRQVKEGDWVFDEEDKWIARAALEEVAKRFRLSRGSIEWGLKKKPSCRFEEMEWNGKRVILDVAHNVSAFEVLWRDLEKRWKGKKIRVVFGISRDKDAEGVVMTFPKKVSHVHVLENFHYRSLEKEQIFFYLDKKKIQYTEEISVEDGLQRAIEGCSGEEILLVCGSFFLMNRVRKFLGISEPSDY